MGSAEDKLIWSLVLRHAVDVILIVLLLYHAFSNKDGHWSNVLLIVILILQIPLTCGQMSGLDSHLQNAAITQIGVRVVTMALAGYMCFSRIADVANPVYTTTVILQVTGDVGMILLICVLFHNPAIHEYLRLKEDSRRHYGAAISKFMDERAREAVSQSVPKRGGVSASCPSCRGKGYHMQTVTENCTQCRGWRQSCSSCGGTHVIYRQQRVACHCC
jgi:hypothetical protein